MKDLKIIKRSELNKWDFIYWNWDVYVYEWTWMYLLESPSVRFSSIHDEYILCEDWIYKPYFWLRQYKIDSIYDNMLSKKYVARKRVCIQDVILYMRENSYMDINYLNAVWWNLFKNIEAQSDECIDFVYTLTKD